MTRGTTPINIFTVDFSLTQVVELYITYAQGGCVKIEKLIDDVTITETETGATITTTLTQEDTLALSIGKVEIQIRLKLNNNSALASYIINTTSDKVLKDGVI